MSVPPGWRWEDRDMGERLQAGDVFEYGGAEYRVEYVNESRAYCLPIGRREVEVPTDEVDEETGDKVTKKFTARDRGINIAPTSSVKILRREDMAKRLCTICGKALHSDNKGDTHRACRKTANPIAEAIDTAATVDYSGDGGEPIADTEDSATAEPTAATAQTEEKTVAKAPKAKAAKKVAAPKGEGRQVNSYQLAAKQPKEGEFRGGSQIEAVYKAVEAIGTATAAEVVKRIQGKVKTKGNLVANVAFYLSKLKGAGFIKVAR